jgi:hypothetical protein
MSDSHRNPRPRVPRQPTPANPPRRRRGTRARRAVNFPVRALQEMRVAFRDLVRLNPRAASTTLDLLDIISSANRQRSMRLMEVASTLVASFRGAA